MIYEEGKDMLKQKTVKILNVPQLEAHQLILIFLLHPELVQGLYRDKKSKR
jgi:hypothetical protein